MAEGDQGAGTAIAVDQEVENEAAEIADYAVSAAALVQQLADLRGRGDYSTSLIWLTGRALIAVAEKAMGGPIPITGREAFVEEALGRAVEIVLEAAGQTLEVRELQRAAEHATQAPGRA